MRYREETEIRAGESVEAAVERCKEALKERLWREVWRDCVEVSGVRWRERGGRLEVWVEEEESLT